MGKVDQALEKYGEELKKLLEDPSVSAEDIAGGLTDLSFPISPSTVRGWRRENS